MTTFEQRLQNMFGVNPTELQKKIFELFDSKATWYDDGSFSMHITDQTNILMQMVVFTSIECKEQQKLIGKLILRVNELENEVNHMLGYTPELEKDK